MIAASTSPTADGRALGQEALTHSGRPQPQNSSSGHAKPPFATRVVRFVPVLDSSDLGTSILRTPGAGFAEKAASDESLSLFPVLDYRSVGIGDVRRCPLSTQAEKRPIV